MKILMVFTSHDQLADTGLKNGFLAGRGCGSLLCFQGRRRSSTITAQALLNYMAA
jgi:hypothetical protein